MKSFISVRVTRCITVILLILLLAAVFFLPFITDWYLKTAGRPPKLKTVILTVCYLCTPAAFASLAALERLLKNISVSNVFINKNVLLLKILSLCCFYAAVITLAAGWFYMPFYVVGIAAAFFALILKVIKNVFCAAIEIKSENELTI